MFAFASSLAPTAAKLSVSMGAPQIMGFNYDAIGYESVEEMFDAFSSDARSHLFGLFDFIQRDPARVRALQRLDYVAFAASYNGTAQAAHYGALLREQVDLFAQILARQAAVSFDINTSFEIDTSSISFLPPLWPLLAEQPEPEEATEPWIPETAEDSESQAASGQAQPEIDLDASLKAAWLQHVRQGLESNNVMFKRILQGFMIPYYLTVLLYLVLFIVGVGLFVVAAQRSADSETQLAAFFFGGLGVLTFLAFFVSRPLRALEENLQFITWLGIVYNSYWTRLLYMQDRATVQDDLEKATQETIQEIRGMITMNAKLARRRFNIPLPGTDAGTGSESNTP